ncbi:MAG: succinate--CoA ligase subunit beta [Spirochaetales bacterium]|nr:succinate--CoA ligase subunit beta [Spirochaetales bacterium]
MRLFEYEAKEVFRRYGIPVPESALIYAPEEAEGAAGKLGYPCVLKAQVLSGGRGKAGLVKVVSNPENTAPVAAGIFDSPAATVDALLVEQAVEPEGEMYLSITVDPLSARALVMASASGGVEIETLAAENPEKILRESFDISSGLLEYQARNIAYSLHLQGGAAKEMVKILMSLYGIFRDLDAELVEINPLFSLPEGTFVAGDAKLILDDNAAGRREGFPLRREYFESEIEYRAAKEGIPYLQFDGDISLMCAGAGLTTTVFDLVHYEGGTVANYLEFGGPNYTRATEAMELCLANPSKVILAVTFGTIARADVMARGLVEALDRLKPDRPIVTCIRGTNEEEAVKILSAAGLQPFFDTEEAVRKAVALAKGGEQ